MHSEEMLADDLDPSKEVAEAALDLAVGSRNEDTDGQELRELRIDELATEPPVFAL